MARDYPGSTDIPTAHPDWRKWAVTDDERRLLRALLDGERLTKIKGHPEFATFIKELVNCIHLYRGWRAIAEECRLKSRRANVRARLEHLRSGARGEPPPRLSLINRMMLSRIREERGCEEQDGLSLLLSHLMDLRRGRGARPYDEIEYLINDVAHAYRRAFTLQPTTTKEGPFARIVTQALFVGSNGARTSIHPHLDNWRARAVTIEAETYLDSEGSTIERLGTFALSRFADRQE